MIELKKSDNTIKLDIDKNRFATQKKFDYFFFIEKSKWLMWRKYFGKLGCLPPKRGSWKSTTLRTARRRTISSRSATTRKWCGRRLTKSDADSPNVRTDPTNAPGRLSAPADDRPSNIRNTFTTTSAIIAPCKFRFSNCFPSGPTHWFNWQLIGTLVYPTEATTWNVWAVLTRRVRRAAAAKARANCASSAPILVRTPICGSIVVSSTPRGISGSATTIPKKDSTGKNTVGPLVSAPVKSTRSSDASKRKTQLVPRTRKSTHWVERRRRRQTKMKWWTNTKLKTIITILKVDEE